MAKEYQHYPIEEYPDYLEDFEAEEELEIDWMAWCRKVWSRRRMILKVCSVAAALGLLFAFSMQRKYTTTVIMAQEVKSSSSSSGLRSLASMVGINLRSGSTQTDAIFPEIYPDIIASTPFLMNLYDAPIKTIDGKYDTTLYDYILNGPSGPWYTYVIKGIMWVPKAVIGLFRGEQKELQLGDNANGKTQTRLRYVTKDEAKVLRTITKCISLDVDKKTGVITLQVTMNDPLASGMLADTVLRSLQSYITHYRTNKAREDLEYNQKLYDEAKAEYEKALDENAKFSDSNRNISLESRRTEQVRLKNEMNITYQSFTLISQQLELAKAKVQENKPAYAVIQPPVVPRKSSNSRMLVLIIWIFLGFLGSVAWAFFGDQAKEKWAELRGKNEGEKFPAETEA